MGGIIVLTASADSFPGLAERLRALSVTVEERPLMRFVPPDDWTAVDRALDGIGIHAASSTGLRTRQRPDPVVVFTSPRAVRAVAERMDARRLVWLVNIDLWVAGHGTARVVREHLGDREMRMPPAEELGRHGAAAALGEAMVDAGITGPVLFPCGDHRRDEFPEGLRAAGVQVDEVVCYRSIVASEADARAAVAEADVVIVASPTVARVVAAARSAGRRQSLLAIGPITAAASEAAGWPPAAVALSPTTEAIGAAARSLLP